MKKYLFYILLTAFAVKADAQDGFQKSARGVRFKIITNNPGPRIKENEVVTFNLTQRNDKDSLLNSTYKMGAPAQAQVKGTEDMMAIFPLLTVKDSVWIKVPTDTLFAGREADRPSFFAKGSDLNIYIKVERVQSMEEAMAEATAARAKAEAEAKEIGAKAEAEESGALTKYIADKSLVLATTASGLKYKITKQGTGLKPAPGDSVFVNYTGRTLEGKVFDSSVEADAKAAGLQQPGRNYEPIAFPVGQGAVIQGWDEGLLLLNAGTKATFVIPSKLAYGANAAGPEIKAFSPLVFDVELVKVKKAKAVKPIAKKTTAKKPAVKTSTVKKTTTVTKKKQ
ncbi:FKBP-type peptidyl-prolyl cis-trans isomerase [Mucilaginibacter antarcticus]|uniref:peptidylprolyl isomerase n=1 Tax=Mucilaginibacter antarcticus TaxID=1855725 RepID=A0ABW5XNI2_9SPHI